MERPSPPAPLQAWLDGLGLYSLTTWAHLPRLRRLVPPVPTPKGIVHNFRVYSSSGFLSLGVPHHQRLPTSLCQQMNPSQLHSLAFCSLHQPGTYPAFPSFHHPYPSLRPGHTPSIPPLTVHTASTFSSPSTHRQTYSTLDPP